MRILLSAILLSFVNSLMSQPSESVIDSLFANYSGTNTPGATVMVIKDGKPIFAKAYGMAHLEKQLPCSIETNFRLASVTKQFTAMAVLTLAERGKLSLDDKLHKYFPEFPEYGKEITVRHLLTHTSGIPDYEDHMPEGLKIPLSDRDVLHILMQQDHLYFAPGTNFRYSNSGYAMLALLVEIVSGQTFPAYLEEHIFKPLGMNNSIAYVAGISEVPNRAHGYNLENGKWTYSDQSLTSAVLGDGGIYSSVTDLFRWDQALYTEKLVSKKTLEDAFTVHSKKSDFDSSGYGYGWYIGDRDGVKNVWHYGSTCGFRTYFSRFPEKRFSIIILTNRREPALDELAGKLTALYLQSEGTNDQKP